MAYHGVQLPEQVERGAQGGPGFKTTILELSSGFEKRNIDWERTRGRWDLSYGIDDKASQEAILAFFYARQGKAHSFPFKDWGDFEIGDVDNGVVQTIGTGDNIVTKFQISRLYTDGTFFFARAVTRPVASTVKIYFDDILQVSGFSVDADTGVVAFDVAPGAAVVVGSTAKFNVPCRFDIDQLDLRLFTADAYSIPAIPIIEDKEELASLA